MQAQLRARPAAPGCRPPAATAAAAAAWPRMRGRAPLRVAALAAGATDHTVRVRGAPLGVSYYIADLARWPDWSPVTKSAAKLGVAGELVSKGTKFELKQELWGMLAYPMTYQILEFEPGKKLVLSGLSEHHTQLDQFVFMPDSRDPNMTVVRYVSDAKLRQWKSALMLVMPKLLARVPADSIAALQTLLNGPRSPLLAPDFQKRYSHAVHRAAAADARKGRKSTATTAPGARRGGGGGGGVVGWSFDSLFGGGKHRQASAAAGYSSSAAAAAAAVAPLDPAGHYLALGLAFASPAAGGVGPSDAEVRAAYRRLVMELHPDKQAGKSAAAQRRAADGFSRVLRAYEVLRDPESRALYDAGQLVESSVDL